MLKTTGLAALSFFFTTAFACTGADHARPLNVIADQASELLHKRQFKTLDKLAAEFRDKNSLASDGQPRLMGFYSGLAKSDANCRTPNHTEAQWEEHKTLLTEWARVSAQPTVPRLALAELETSYAWRARGSGYANTVTEEGWVLFRKRLANSRAMLENMPPEARNDPDWYSAMLTVALGQGWKPEQFDQLYRQAVGKYPYYFAYYFTKGQFYSAKWHGSQDEFKDFVNESVKATEQKLGQTMYARLNWSAYSNTMFQDGQTDWSRMKHGFDKMLADFPDPWNRNNFAKFACIAGDKKTLREQLELIGDHVASAAWIDISYYHSCRRFVGLPPKG